MSSREPRIVLFDLETIPNLPKALEVWPGLSAYPGLTLKATISTIICAGYKIFGQSKTHCINAWDFKNWNKDINDDYEVVKAISDVLQTADAVVTHNGKRFDWKFLQTRIMHHKLPPLPKIKHMDTKQLAKQHLFAFNNRLNTVGELLAEEKKLSHEGWELWVKVCRKDQTAMNKMEKYCKQDVNLLEKVYKRLIPLIGNIPNYNRFSLAGHKDQCPMCGSTRLMKWGYYYTKTMVYQRLRCKDCHGTSRVDASGKNPRSL